MSNATLNKCPACGELRQSFTAVCPTCGYEFTDVCESRASQAIYQEIAKYDNSLMDEDSSSSGLSFWTIVGWIFLFPIMMAIFLVKVGSRTASSLPSRWYSTRSRLEEIKISMEGESVL